MTSGEKRASGGGALQKEVHYTYDIFGNRIERQVDSIVGIESQYLVSDGRLWADAYHGYNPVKRYLAGDQVDQVFARSFRDSSNTTPDWYLPDHLGSTRAIVNNSGSTIATLTYDSFGNLTSAEDPDADRFRFTGREWDKELGLYYYRARSYDPQTGRFIQNDPIGFAAGDANLYRYVGNGATNATDPWGEDAVTNWFFGRVAAGILWANNGEVPDALKGPGDLRKDADLALDIIGKVPIPGVAPITIGIQGGIEIIDAVTCFPAGTQVLVVDRGQLSSEPFTEGEAFFTATASPPEESWHPRYLFLSTVGIAVAVYSALQLRGARRRKCNTFLDELGMGTRGVHRLVLPN